MTTETPLDGDRIAKLLARAGIASRREVERMIAEGRIAIDGKVLDTPATVLSSLAGVTVDGNPVAAPEPARLFLYHKPPGLLVTERDPAGRLTIYDRLPRDLPRLVPVGRLDLATEGLLLLTTDGGLKRTLELPSTGVERTYRARAYGEITQARLEELIDGIEIEGIRYGSIDANLERRTGANVWIELTLTEGKNREVRRVLEFMGLQVSRLIRTRYGPFVLGELQPGELGEARGADIATFRRSLDGPRKGKGQEQAIVEVEARTVAAPPPPPPAPDRRQQAEPARSPRPAAAAARPVARQTAGWGSRTRPSQPRVEPDAARSRARPTMRDASEPRVPRVEPAGERTDMSRPRGRPNPRDGSEMRAPRGDASRDRTDMARPRGRPALREGSEMRTPRGEPSRDRTDQSRARGRPTRDGSEMRTPDRMPGRTEGRTAAQTSGRTEDDRKGRFVRDRGDQSAARPARTDGDPRRRSDAGPARPVGGKPAGRGPAKGPAGGRGHPPRPPKGGAPRGGKR